jgi:hypothetical protein
MGLLVRAHFYFEERAVVLGNRPPVNKTRIQLRSSKGLQMIIFVAVKLKQIFKKQCNYPWPRPDLCPRCKASGVWGHGFVAAYFDALPGCVMLRRYRCPQCHCVIRMRPAGYFRRFQASIKAIYESLSLRLSKGGYLPGLSRSRQRHWLKALIRNVNAYLGQRWRHLLLAGFMRLLAMGQVPVGSRI